MKKMYLGAILLGGLMPASLPAEEVDKLIEQARTALKREKFDDALKAADKATELDPKSTLAHFVRGEALGSMRRHKDAITAFEMCLKLDPKFHLAVDRRGGEHFKLGMIKESLQDFDRFLEAVPKAYENHWRRGISLYYDKQFVEGAKQFKAGEKYYDADVENAFWHYLCLARVDGIEKARPLILKVKVEEDKRVPMKEVYSLIQGKAKPADVIEAANANADKINAEDKNERLFYAHLYVALNHEAEGDAKKAEEHMRIAVEKHKITHYMWDVANVHLMLMTKK
jgi:lipoprotein NlpI